MHSIYERMFAETGGSGRTYTYLSLIGAAITECTAGIIWKLPLSLKPRPLSETCSHSCQYQSHQQQTGSKQLYSEKTVQVSVGLYTHVHVCRAYVETGWSALTAIGLKLLKDKTFPFAILETHFLLHDPHNERT